MNKLDRYFDKLMDDYYLVLINAWDDKLKESARYAITQLTGLDQNQRVNEQFLKDLDWVIRQKMGKDFVSAIDSDIKTFCEMSYKVSAQEDQFAGMKFSFSPADQRNIEILHDQQSFWLRNHYDDSTSKKINDILEESIKNNYTNKELADQLENEFSDLVKGSRVYYEGLAEHTALRIREFGRLKNYERLGATHYKIVAVMDSRTSDICKALNGKIFPLGPAFKSMKAIFEVHEKYDSFADAKEHLKRIAPFVTDDQIEFDKDGNPTGIEGMHTPFPPFHWRCRTRTVMI